MKEQLITFETARLAKEKGFNIPTDSFWQVNEKTFGIRHRTGYPLYYAEGCSQYSQPTQSLLQKWLREVHNIVVLVFLHNTRYGCTIKNLKEKEQVRFVSENCLTYEKTLEEGLLEGLKFIINNEQN